MKYQDLCTKRTYEVNGEEKTKWFNIGTLKTTDTGKQFIEINILPDTDIFVFDRKEKEQESGF